MIEKQNRPLFMDDEEIILDFKCVFWGWETVDGIDTRTNPQGIHFNIEREADECKKDLPEPPKKGSNGSKLSQERGSGARDRSSNASFREAPPINHEITVNTQGYSLQRCQEDSSNDEQSE
jgi:hypothetical protein